MISVWQFMLCLMFTHHHYSSFDRVCVYIYIGWTCYWSPTQTVYLVTKTAQMHNPPLSLSLSLQQHATSNTVVVTAQPAPQVHTVYRTGNSEYALPAIIFAVAITVCFLSLGCWYAIICSGIGIALAAAVSLRGPYSLGALVRSGEARYWGRGCI